MGGLVRLIGNLCYQCKTNQDIVRETKIPIQKPNDMSNDYTSTTNDFNSKEAEQNRNGLHVMLSCTTFAYGCFTLREWGIVAIRNILDGNNANQEEVAKLEAQQVINTPELEKFGIKLNLNKKGKIVVDRNDINNHDLPS